MKSLEQIESGLQNSEFYLEYIPTMSLIDDRCVGAEALIRWKHLDEVVSPMEFIPVVENTPMAGLVTYWVIEEVARDLGDWLRSNQGIHIGINVPPDLIGRGGLQYAASKAGLIDVADKLILEITERGFPDQQALDSLGFRGKTRVAIDDFGTGDANLYQLSKMDADIIKIDKAFVDQITSDSEIPKIMKGLTAFALAMDLELIAEGVESEIQAKVLKGLGVHMAQGWYFSRPLAADRFLDFYANSRQ